MHLLCHALPRLYRAVRRHSFNEIPEVRACETPDRCEIIDPIEFAKTDHSADGGDRLFQKAREMLGMT